MQASYSQAMTGVAGEGVGVGDYRQAREEQGWRSGGERIGNAWERKFGGRARCKRVQIVEVR